jgi:hypothetical protein
MVPRRGPDPAAGRLEALYQAPLGEFVKARNTLAAALKREGNLDAADRVKTLSKPTPGAWALNQVYWRARAVFDRMIRAGDDLRRLQEQMLAGRTANLREAMAERQAAVHDVVERAAEYLREDGNAVTAATRQRLATSADAMAAYGSGSASYQPGQLADDIDAPGFAALATLGGPGLRLVHGARAASPKAPPPAAPARHDPRTERQEAREREAAAKREAAERAKAIRTAEQSLRDATRELDSVRQRAERAREAAEAVAQEQKTLEEQLARVTARRRSADAAASAAADAVSAAERVRRDAEGALTTARDTPARRS